MVDNISDAIRRVEAAGGVITQPLGVDAPELTARFRDPAGNIIGLYQNP
jgi:predicted enzyme related to lactoylglutathione lyase